MNGFVADIIKALPDAVATAIVTVFLTGGILFVFQERIRTALAKSLYEYQTKFSINHAKTVEALDILYKKFVKFNNAVDELIFAKKYAKTKTEDNEWHKKAANADDLLKDFWNYYKENRLFLPSAIADNISELYHKTEMVSLMLTQGLLRAEPDKGHNLKWERFSLFLGREQYNDAETFITDVRKELDRKARYLESLYKSVAETK